MAQELPPYILHSADFNSGLPYSFIGARYFNFILKGDMDRLQRLCDTFINRPSNFNVSVKPLVPFVIVTFADYPQAYSEALPPEKYGWMQYQEAVFTVVLQTAEGFCGMGGEAVSFIPYLFLDNPRAIAAGREVFSLPKVHGRVVIPKPGDCARPNFFNCRLLTLPELGPGSMAKMCEILRVDCAHGFVPQPSVGDKQDPWTQIDSHVYGAFGSKDGVSQEQSKTLTRSQQLKFINLRQFRGFPDTSRALRKSIFAYQARNMSFADGGPLLGDFELGFPERSPLFPIVETLGLLPRVYSAFWYEWTFQFVMGEDMWGRDVLSFRP